MLYEVITDITGNPVVDGFQIGGISQNRPDIPVDPDRDGGQEGTSAGYRRNLWITDSTATGKSIVNIFFMILAPDKSNGFSADAVCKDNRIFFRTGKKNIFNRITSYNVCYTKLLRSQNCSSRRPARIQRRHATSQQRAIDEVVVYERSCV